MYWSPFYCHQEWNQSESLKKALKIILAGDDLDSTGLWWVGYENENTPKDLNEALKKFNVHTPATFVMNVYVLTVLKGQPLHENSEVMKYFFYSMV